MSELDWGHQINQWWTKKEEVEAFPLDELNPDKTDRNGWTALATASFQGHTLLVDYLLNRGCDANANVTIRYTTRALIMAAKRGHVDIIRLLVNHGADIHNQDGWWGKSALLHAIEGGHVEATFLLLELGANPFDHQSSYSSNALNLSIKCCKVVIIKNLLEDYPSLNFHRCPWYDLLQNGDNTTITRLLLANQDRFSCSCSSNYQWRAHVVFAAKFGRINVFSMLMEHGGSEPHYEEALRTAVEYDEYSIVRLLLNAGTNPYCILSSPKSTECAKILNIARMEPEKILTLVRAYSTSIPVYVQSPIIEQVLKLNPDLFRELVSYIMPSWAPLQQTLSTVEVEKKEFEYRGAITQREAIGVSDTWWISSKFGRVIGVPTKDQYQNEQKITTFSEEDILYIPFQCT